MENREDFIATLQNPHVQMLKVTTELVTQDSIEKIEKIKKAVTLKETNSISIQDKQKIIMYANEIILAIQENRIDEVIKKFENMAKDISVLSVVLDELLKIAKDANIKVLNNFDILSQQFYRDR